MVWTESDIHIERIFPDEHFWLDNVSLAKDFFVTSILPELFGKFYSRINQPKRSDTTQDPCCSGTSGETTDGEGESCSNDVPVYCYCQKPEGGDMVACDNSACTREWFHLRCLGLKVFPTTKHWYCPDCRKLQQKGKKQRKL